MSCQYRHVTGRSSHFDLLMSCAVTRRRGSTALTRPGVSSCQPACRDDVPGDLPDYYCTTHDDLMAEVIPPVCGRASVRAARLVESARSMALRAMERVLVIPARHPKAERNRPSVDDGVARSPRSFPDRLTILAVGVATRLHACF